MWTEQFDVVIGVLHVPHMVLVFKIALQYSNCKIQCYQVQVLVTDMDMQCRR